MKTKILITILALNLAACNKLDRILNGSEEEIPISEVISSTPGIGEAPNFDIPTPTGFDRIVYHGEMPIDGKVTINASNDTDSYILVFIKERAINQWFTVNESYSSAFWHEYNKATGLVQYHGHMENKEFAIYQYVPGDQDVY